jgi:hypothetical protein
MCRHEAQCAPEWIDHLDPGWRGLRCRLRSPGAAQLDLLKFGHGSSGAFVRTAQNARFAILPAPKRISDFRPAPFVPG